MPTPYTPSPGIGATDPALPDGPPVNLASAREALDNRRYLRGATWGLLTGSGRFEVGGTATTPTVVVGAIEAIVLRRSSGAVRAFFAGETTTSGKAWSSAIGYAAGDHVVSGGTVWRALGTVAPGAAAPSAGPSWAEGLAADDWYYAYAINAGTDAASSMAFELSRTGPTASGLFKDDGAPTELKRYLGCFRTDSTGKPFPMLAVRGRCLYRRSAIASVDGAFGANGLRAVPIATGVTARTDLDLSARVPPHARRAVLVAHVLLTSGSGASAASTDLYDAADTTSPSQSVTALVAATGDKAQATGRCEVQLTSAQLCGYAIVSAVGTANGAVDVMGWEE